MERSPAHLNKNKGKLKLIINVTTQPLIFSTTDQGNDRIGV